MKYADEIVKEVENRELDTEGTVNGEAFEEWLYSTDFFGIAPETVFSEKVYSRMQGKEMAFAVFVNTGKICNMEEYNSWIAEHGLQDETPRLLYMYVNGNKGRGYVVNYTRKMQSLLIPEDLLTVTYQEFMDKILS